MGEPSTEVTGGALIRARRASGVVALLALLVVAATGAALTWRYHPNVGGPGYLLSPAARWSRRLERWHEASMLGAVAVLALWGSLTAVAPVPSGRRKGLGIVAAGGAIALIALTARAWQWARWEQLALWAVTVGSEINGLWYAAFSDEVRFVLVAGRGEVPPSDLAPWVTVHLLAPVLALLLAAVAWKAVEPPRPGRRSIAKLPASGAGPIEATDDHRRRMWPCPSD